MSSMSSMRAAGAVGLTPAAAAARTLQQNAGTVSAERTTHNACRPGPWWPLDAQCMLARPLLAAGAGGVLQGPETREACRAQGATVLTGVTACCVITARRGLGTGGERARHRFAKSTHEPGTAPGRASATAHTGEPPALPRATARNAHARCRDLGYLGNSAVRGPAGTAREYPRRSATRRRRAAHIRELI